MHTLSDEERDLLTVVRGFVDNEVAPAALVAADAYVCDRLSQVRLLGELHHAIEAGKVDALTVFPELGEIVAGAKPGRGNDAQTVICDLTGTGAQDTAIASHVFAGLGEAGTRITI